MKIEKYSVKVYQKKFLFGKICHKCENEFRRHIMWSVEFWNYNKVRKRFYICPECAPSRECITAKWDRVSYIKAYIGYKHTDWEREDYINKSYQHRHIEVLSREYRYEKFIVIDTTKAPPKPAEPRRAKKEEIKRTENLIEKLVHKLTKEGKIKEEGSFKLDLESGERHLG